MKRILKIIGKTIFILLVMLIGVVLFAPYDKIGEYVLYRAEERALSSGVTMSHSAVTKNNESFSGIKIERFLLKSLMAGVDIDGMSVNPSLTDSLLTFSPFAKIKFDKGKLYFRGEELFLQNASFTVIIRGSIITVYDILIDGDMKMHGSVSFNTETFKIETADAELTGAVGSPSLSKLVKVMETLKNILPLTEETPERWKLKR